MGFLFNHLATMFHVLLGKELPFLLRDHYIQRTRIFRIAFPILQQIQKANAGPVQGEDASQ